MELPKYPRKLAGAEDARPLEHARIIDWPSCIYLHVRFEMGIVGFNRE